MRYVICVLLFVGILLLGIYVLPRRVYLFKEDKRYKQLMYVCSLLMLWPLADYSWIYATGIGIAGIFVYFYPVYQKQKEEENSLRRLRYDFPIWLRQIQILLQNNNVQHSLEKSLPQAPMIMQEELRTLIDRLNQNATDLTAYLNFMSEYDIYEISRAMKLLYRYHMVGAEESYHQFHRMLESTGKWLRAERKRDNDSLIMMLNWIGLIPLLGCTVMFVSMMILIVMNMMKGGLV
ncbi:MAG: hypothetical protein IJP28_00470 [Erysipelotrichales bacterium]|nr:hypothetical protein [Erysipelotrichales bacterium]MBR3694560.1 hypothetical protein [Erysipelotrichales bacterium]